ncbi:hypothetical protein [Natronococcus occultus]|uniref:Uncharacterized protein n=1 Tax=Natronococcus occultus SP4 TaxID=694430 RepID=L0K044_9EURY|nr:hypothetical protein [Natronococcus occultus]AGB37493.1 hypothetical protein Natoc_1688 [Natronococcus occultus SP4]
MKWRCTWCGEPHEENDPPCRECGHNSFEKAVVRADETEAEPTRTETVDTGTTYVWRCQDCGRDHVKNNPPCSRCNGHDLRKVEQRYDDVDRELEVPGWLDVAKPYLPVFAVLGVVVVLFATGIISPSILPGLGSPSPPDAPGEGAEAAGIDLAETERLVHDRLEDDRTDATSAYDDDLAAFAEYQNRAFVAQEYADAEPDPAEPGEFGVDCEAEFVFVPFAMESSIDDYDSEAALAEDVAAALASTDDGEAVLAGPPGEGIDVHVVEGTIHVVYAAC